MGDLGCDIADSLDRLCVEIVAPLRASRVEIVQAIYTRVQEAVPEPVASQDPAYLSGVLDTIAVVLDYVLDAIEYGPEWSGPIPEVAAIQARRAARAGVSLGTVLRRYLAAHSCLGEFVAREAHDIGASSEGVALELMRKTQQALLERLTASIEHEYDDERRRLEHSSIEQRIETVRRLLDDQPVDAEQTEELNYEIASSWHLAAIGVGGDLHSDLWRIKANLDCEILTVPDGETTTWIWFGAARKIEVADVERILVADDETSIAFGGGGLGLAGWRQTHREARSALSHTQLHPEKAIRYADEPLTFAALENETLSTWLQEFLAPLRNTPDGGKKLLNTLRAYLDAECNCSSAAAALEIRRQTVRSRLRTAETLLDRPLRECLAELDVALNFHYLELGDHRVRSESTD
jgi:hypothetical protein